MSAADRLAAVLETAHARLAAMSEEQASRRAAPGRWTSKEVLGHLIDSAGNNHQRIVRAQLQADLEFPGYEQESWVDVQKYQDEPWAGLVNTWLHLNLHLLHVVRIMPAVNGSRTLSIGGKPATTLSAVIEDYVHHLEHHLTQIS